MPDRANPGQFGNRTDTAAQARKGGAASSGKFGSAHGADPVEAGRKGGEASSGKFGSAHGADPVEAGRKGGTNSHSGKHREPGPPPAPPSDTNGERAEGAADGATSAFFS